MKRAQLKAELALLLADFGPSARIHRVIISQSDTYCEVTK